MVIQLLRIVDPLRSELMPLALAFSLEGPASAVFLLRSSAFVTTVPRQKLEQLILWVTQSWLCVLKFYFCLLHRNAYFIGLLVGNHMNYVNDNPFQPLWLYDSLPIFHLLIWLWSMKLSYFSIILVINSNIGLHCGLL